MDNSNTGQRFGLIDELFADIVLTRRRRVYSNLEGLEDRKDPFDGLSALQYY